MIKYFLLVVALLCGCSPVKKVTSNEFFIEKTAGEYIGAIAIADSVISGKCSIYYSNYKKDWPDINQAMYEFKNVLTSEYIANRPYISQRLIEEQVINDIFDGTFEKSLNQIKARFSLVDGTRESCNRLLVDVTMHLTTLQWSWGLFRDNSYWGRAMAEYQRSAIKANGGKPPSENILPKLTFDQLQEGFQRIDYFRKQRDIGLITQREFEIRRAKILETLY